MLYTLSKSEILRGKQNFQRIYSLGKKIYKNKITCIYLIEKKETPENKIQVGFSVNRKIKLAVLRNRLKRLMREAFRLNKNILNFEAVKHYNIFLIFYFHKILENKKIKFQDVAEEIISILKQVSEEILRVESI